MPNEIELSESKLPLQDFLKARNSRWRLVGPVHFNLAENRRDQDYPFAFTAWPRPTASCDICHSARSYGAGAGDKAKLLQLLAPVQQASEACAWLKNIVDAAKSFIPALDAAGRGALPPGCRGNGAGRPRHPHAGQLAHEPEPPFRRGPLDRHSPLFSALTHCWIFEVSLDGDPHHRENQQASRLDPWSR